MFNYCTFIPVLSDPGDDIIITHQEQSQIDRYSMPNHRATPAVLFCAYLRAQKETLTLSSTEHHTILTDKRTSWEDFPALDLNLIEFLIVSSQSGRNGIFPEQCSIKKPIVCIYLSCPKSEVSLIGATFGMLRKIPLAERPVWELALSPVTCKSYQRLTTTVHPEK